MTIKIAVCDDELQTVKQIETCLAQIQKEAALNFQVFFFSSGEDLIEHMPRDINVLLLDIKMSGLSGIETARVLRKEDNDFYLFFITSNPQYALEGYSVHAYAFLCKPIQYAHLKTYLLEVISHINNPKVDTIELKSGNISTIVNCSELVFLEVYGHTCIAVMTDGRKIICKMALDKLELVLRNRGFFRCHKSYLINMNRIQSIRRVDIMMDNGAIIALSRSRKRDFLVAFREVMGK